MLVLDHLAMRRIGLGVNERGGQVLSGKCRRRPELGLQVQAPSLGDWICNPVAGRLLTWAPTVQNLDYKSNLPAVGESI